MSMVKKRLPNFCKKRDYRKTVDAEGGLTAYDYDDENNLLSVTDELNRSTTFTYDAASRIIKIDDIDGTSDYNYNQTNQLTEASHTDSNKENESYTYDDNGNRINSHLHGSDYATGLNKMRKLGSIIIGQGIMTDK